MGLVRSEVDAPKRLPIAEFVDRGYLQEVNRRLLHPLGLALEVERASGTTRVLLLRDEDVGRIRTLARRVAELVPSEADNMGALERLLDDSERLFPGDARLSSVWDCRDDPEGVVFGDGLVDAEKAGRVTDELHLRALAREATLGYVVQPVTEKP